MEQVEELKLCGFIFDVKMRWGPMIDMLAKKARSRMAALKRLRFVLDDANMKTMYIMFVRSVMEYGNVVYMGAADSHLAKLDRVQKSAEQIGNFTVESLECRREAAAISLALKLLDNQGRGRLQDHKPKLIDVKTIRFSRHTSNGLKLQSVIKAKSLDVYKRGFFGVVPVIWNRIPQSIIAKGKERGWLSIKKVCTTFLIKEDNKNNIAKTKSRKRDIANTHTILPSAGSNQEINAGQHMTTTDCLADYSKLKKTKKELINKC